MKSKEDRSFCMNQDLETEEESSIDDSMFGGLNFKALDTENITSSGDEEESLGEEIKQTLYDPSRVDQLLKLQQAEFPCATETDFNNLFTWAESEGAVLDGVCYNRDEYGGRTLFASRDFSEGWSLASLPRSLRIGQAEACRKLGLPFDTPDLSALTLLNLAFCEEKHVYARCLPRKSEFTNALLMGKKEQTEWENRMGPEYGDAFKVVQSRGNSCGMYIRGYLSSQASESSDCTSSQLNEARPSHATENSTMLNWAISMVKSRSHAFGTKRGYWLTPVFDMVNHSTSPNAQLEGDFDGGLAMKALRSIEAGEEITIDYQVDDDTQLLAIYGFSLEASVQSSVQRS